MSKNTIGFIEKRFVLFIILVFPFTLFSEYHPNKYMCVKVLDGDTIFIIEDEKEVKIKLDGIDCPELGQDFGKQAKQFTSDLVFGKIIEVKTISLDKDKTIIAYISVEKSDVSLELIKAGMAWNYKRFSSDDPIYALAEKDAKNAKIGLWSMPNPISPWDFRSSAFKLIQTKSQSVPSIPSEKTQPPLTPVSTQQPTVQNVDSQPETIEQIKEPSVTEYYEERRKKGLERFEEEIQELAKKADEMDIQYTRYNDACFNKYTSGNIAGNTMGFARGRIWFSFWSGGFSIDNESTVECRKIWSDFSRIVREIKRGIESSMEYARKAGVYPGQLRKVREQYRLDWSGWD